MARTALICLLFVTCPAVAFKGDGELVDRGAGSGQSRFELDLGPVDLERNVQHEYRFSELPGAEFTFGLLLKAPSGERLSNLPLATVRMTLINEKDQVVFTISEELPNWMRSESSGEWFLYSRGAQEIVTGKGVGGAKRVGLGPDGGWGTYVQPRPEAEYRLMVETVKPDVRLSKFVARAVAVASGKPAGQSVK